MTAFALLLLLASSRVDISDEIYEIAPEKWGYGPVVQLNQQPALIGLNFESENRSDRVRLALMRREEMEKLRAGLPHGVIEASGDVTSGILSYRAPAPAEYVVVIENSARTPASVRVRVWLDFSQGGPLVTQLSPQRQMTVIAVSFVVFFAIVSFSARRLLKIVRR